MYHILFNKAAKFKFIIYLINFKIKHEKQNKNFKSHLEIYTKDIDLIKSKKKKEKKTANPTI